MRELELLAPAKNLEIGIAAIDCGADSVYMAGPKFGARESAGNSFDDIRKLCAYAAGFGAKVYITINTILYDSELSEAEEYLWEAYRAGVGGIIVQDMSLLKMNLPPIPLFASTQTDIRTPEKAAFLEKLGFRRLILARELSLDQIREIRKATSCELEFFVHGALCVCYSGQCYLSEYLTGRSANRGECAQACRSLYTLMDETGDIIKENLPLLSLKDYNLSERLRELADAGISSFKIEGRLKNISYVKNVVSLYNRKLNEFANRASLGMSRTTFSPEINYTFNRGYTELYLDGKRGKWKSSDGAKYLGEPIGNILKAECKADGLISLKYSGKTLNNGDGLTFVTPDNRTFGERANSCVENIVTLNHSLFGKERNKVGRLFPAGTKIFRNFNIKFERELENSKTERLIEVRIDISPKEDSIKLTCHLPEQYGGDKVLEFVISGSPSKNKELCKKNIVSQFEKRAGQFIFTVTDLDSDELYFYKLSELNNIRKSLAETLDRVIRENGRKNLLKATERISPEKLASLQPFALKALKPYTDKDGGITYFANVSNRLSTEFYRQLGYKHIDNAFEIDGGKASGNDILMRTKYCIRKELGICLKDIASKKISASHPLPQGKLYLLNGKNRLTLEFDCKECEMLVKKG